MAGMTARQHPVSGLPLNGGGVTSANTPAPSLSDLYTHCVSAEIGGLPDLLYGLRYGGVRQSPFPVFQSPLPMLPHPRVQGNDIKRIITFAYPLPDLALDYAIVNNEIPVRHQEFPALIKLVCRNRHDSVLQGAILFLMISVKTACEREWFSERDCKELNNLAEEIISTFGSVPACNILQRSSQMVISTIMSRFYPYLRMGQVLAVLEIKLGFNAYAIDFQISKNLILSPEEKIRLFVAQTDNMETSVCIKSPAQANFLINGNGVVKRDNVFMDTRPQIPTIINHFLKYGANTLQAVGEFYGNYIVAVAFMSEMPNPFNSTLKDYEHKASATVDLDSEIIEGPSRISLKCPISYQRIVTPVKGHSCNHHQCFDFNNYLIMNSRRPSWRCPTCNHNVCFIDLRLDRKMVKVLEEVGPNVSEIIISSDGSWNAVMENDDTNMGDAVSAESVDMLDLTQVDDEATDATKNGGTEGTNNVVDQFQFTSQNATDSSHITNISGANQNGSQVLNGFSSGISIPAPVQPHLLPTIPAPNPALQHSCPRSITPNTFSAALQASPVPNFSSEHPVQNLSPAVLQRFTSNGNGFIENSVLAPAMAMAAPLGAPSPTPVLQQNSGNGLSSLSKDSLFPMSVSPSKTSIPSGDHYAALKYLVPGGQPHQENLFALNQHQQQNAGGFKSSNLMQNAQWISNEQSYFNRNGIGMPNLGIPQHWSQQSPSQIQSSVQPFHNSLLPQSHVESRSIPETGASIVEKAHFVAGFNRNVLMQVDADNMMGLPSYSAIPDGSNMLQLMGNEMGNIGGIGTETYDPDWHPAPPTGLVYADDALNQFTISPHNQEVEDINATTSFPTDMAYYDMWGGVGAGSALAPNGYPFAAGPALGWDGMPMP
ncbi:E4 SUMO-protein ligase PIAL2-like [Andrographis paniculata]|uniref:E4 SUMO-protein ligase PIAL2-like n=1 Tax=Andrographis paniculata TaxID=175694 RepID=UPI0021E7E1B7|nr:E4 SUMO-protein ligase PIAL2-like [Andrographis paniculata]